MLVVPVKALGPEKLLGPALQNRAELAIVLLRRKLLDFIALILLPLVP
ncbi:hypothetical protein [Caballeronia arvi]|nr:hypothetical protein [Caballeronia arvi]